MNADKDTEVIMAVSINTEKKDAAPKKVFHDELWIYHASVEKTQKADPFFKTSLTNTASEHSINKNDD
ncbi:hypothetical protein LJU42_25950 (plasmid) [Citrobacter freundii]|uniref:hypothetical protein n=1 Tax=Citrobacter freundii TaxID=546 RepID=UPI00174863CB|nr:hypothetical protein [Citrobacter freundii]HCP9939285.1 hypothetical protein [Escherichia coli]EKW5624702.1 hypothetical protein [Citrobacter freundii]MBJ9085805.1 hypothetical protein [Citrobacter freundii]QMI78369.1 hypothetical protein H1014_24590 [Citrobacter freundii]UDV25180.1 hypothetical protein LJU42_25950 [Citrobacter freundii]